MVCDWLILERRGGNVGHYLNVFRPTQRSVAQVGRCEPGDHTGPYTVSMGPNELDSGTVWTHAHTCTRTHTHTHTHEHAHTLYYLWERERERVSEMTCCCCQAARVQTGLGLGDGSVGSSKLTPVGHHHCSGVRGHRSPWFTSVQCTATKCF